jgi:hypothetical protein
MPRILCAVVVSALIPVIAAAQETQSLAEQAVDPTASLMSLQLFDNYTADIWQQEGTSNKVLFRSAIPFAAWKTPNIFRSTVTYASGGVRGTGIESAQPFDLIVVNKGGADRWSISAGFSLLVPPGR